MITEEELVLDEGEQFRVPNGKRAFIRLQELKATPIEVCEKLVELSPDKARVGDIRELQRLAKVALDAGLKLEFTHEGGDRHPAEAGGDTLRPGSDQDRDSKIAD